MKWIAEIQTPQPLKAIIRQDQQAGYYLYVYKNNESRAIDYLQDTLEWTKTVALEEYGVPITAWKKA